MVGVGVAPLVVVRSILVIILADEEVDSVAAAAAASFSSAAFVFCYDAFSYSFCWGSWEWRRRKEFLKKKREKIKKKRQKKFLQKKKNARQLTLSLSLSPGKQHKKFEREEEEEEEEVFLKLARRSVAFDTPQRFRVGSRDDGRIVTHATETNHKVLRDSFAVSRSDEDEQRIPTSTRIEHEDVGGGDSQDKLGRDANGDEDGRTSVHDERMRESVG